MTELSTRSSSPDERMFQKMCMCIARYKQERLLGCWWWGSGNKPTIRRWPFAVGSSSGTPSTLLPPFSEQTKEILRHLCHQPRWLSIKRCQWLICISNQLKQQQHSVHISRVQLHQQEISLTKTQLLHFTTLFVFRNLRVEKKIYICMMCQGIGGWVIYGVEGALSVDSWDTTATILQQQRKDTDMTKIL